MQGRLVGWLGELNRTGGIDDAREHESDRGGILERGQDVQVRGVGLVTHRIAVDRHHAIALAQLAAAHRRRTLGNRRQQHRRPVEAEAQPETFVRVAL